MKNHKDINDTRYIISRVFDENQTPAMLIEERIMNIIPLTNDSSTQYNDTSGSVKSQEVL